MNSLPEGQKALLAFIRGEGALPTRLPLRFCGNLGAQRALGIYRNNYLQMLKKSLADTFEACRELLGGEVFERLALGFAADHPLGEGDLADYGAGFDVFLGRSRLSRTFAFLAELARLEWVIRGLFCRADGGSEMLPVAHPVHQIWTALLHPGPDSPIEDFLGVRPLTVRRQGERIFFTLGNECANLAP